jgi:phosphatidate cytidylyltransferase
MPFGTSADPPAPSSKGRVFLRRLFSFVVLWTVVIVALFSGNRFISDGLFLIVIMGLAGLGLWEFYGLAEQGGLVCFKWLGVVGGVLLLLGTFLHVQGVLGIWDSPARVNDFETIFLIVFVLGLCLRQFASGGNTAGLLAIATTLFGLMYVPWLLNFLQKITYFPTLNGPGTFYLLYFILVTKCSDIGAYCVGTLLGRHKLIPRVSPHKTWEGFGGAILFSTGASLLFAHFAGPERLVGMNPLHAITLGVLLSVAAVVGDLIESLFKREAGVKDSGRLLPGIGGILDLLDSLLFNAPLMYLYLRHVLTR